MVQSLGNAELRRVRSSCVTSEWELPKLIKQANVNGRMDINDFQRKTFSNYRQLSYLEDVTVITNLRVPTHLTHVCTLIFSKTCKLIL